MRHIRGYIYIFSGALAVLLYLYVRSSAADSSLAAIRLTELYGYLATVYLFCALLPSPLYASFPALPGKPLVTRARRAIGVSTFCFALLHTLIGFFKLLAGFAGLGFLRSYDLWDLAFATVALGILFLMAATSNDWSVRTLGPWWKRLHRFVYLAGLLVLLHIVMLGSHFMELSGPYYAALVTAVGALLTLELIRATRKLSPYLDASELFIVFLTGFSFIALAWAIVVFNGGYLGMLSMGAMGMPVQMSTGSAPGSPMQGMYMP